VKRARFTAPARREFLAHVAYYRTQEADLGARFAAAVEETAARAVAFPLAGPLASKKTRRALVRGFPFSLVYRPESEGIVIFAVAHHSRHPEYWQYRVHERQTESAYATSR
jgi:toxin ParE1/3/4